LYVSIATILPGKSRKMINSEQNISRFSFMSNSNTKIDCQRIFNSDRFFQPTEGEPIRSVITESPTAVIVAWYIKPGQKIAAHLHPYGQDTWTILRGKGEYYLDRSLNTKSIVAGDIVIAPTGCIHGVFNHGDEPLEFISVVSPGEAGYQAI
jgi:quercetin dioxygenase-like cupin family protein